MPPPSFSSMPSQDHGMSSSTPFYNMPSPDSSSVPPSLIRTHGTHSSYLAAMDRRPPSDTTLSKAIQPVSPQLSRSNIGASNSEMCNSEAFPNPSSTPSSVHGPELPPPGELDQLRRVRIIADGEGFYPSRPAANAISAGIQKLYDGFYPTWSDVFDWTKQGVFNEFMLLFGCYRVLQRFPTWSHSVVAFVTSAGFFSVIFGLVVTFCFCRNSLRLSLTGRKVVHGVFTRIGLFKVILRRRHLLYCHACFLKLEVTDGGLDGLGHIIGIVYWQSPKFQNKSNQTKAARKSKKGGSLHTCGSVSMGTAKRKLNRYIQAIEELKKNRPIDDQGNPIMLSEEETLSCWLDVVGGVYKGRAYGLCSEKNFHRLQCGLQCKLPRSPTPSSDDDGEEDEDEDDGEDEMDY
ncbi:hypothetical protein FXO37_03414 [Capsicum annuum]|nr:hypothetical protein FXO37_03414 [Capsicum annuum]